MSQSILLRGAKQLLTLRGKPGVRRGPDFGNLEVIEDGSVFIKGGKIAAVGPTRRMENLKEIRDAIDIPVHNFVVMPGFVDPYVQLNLATRAAKGGVKTRTLSEYNSAVVTLMRACLQHGTLNAGVKASSGICSPGKDLSVLRELIRIGKNPIGLTRSWRPDAAAPLELKAIRDTIATIAKRKLAKSIEVSGSSADYSRFLPANALNLAFNLNWAGGTASDLEAALGHLNPLCVFCHHELSLAECEVLARSRSATVFKVGEALLDHEPAGSLRDLVAAGGGVALGSGYDAVNEQNYSMQLVLALAVRRLHLTIEEAIVATTINSAYAVNCGDEIGSLEPGKRADVLVLNLSDYRDIPRRLGVNHVAIAIREGNLAINRTRWRVGTV